MTYTPAPNSSVSTGTLKTDDLLRAFSAELRRFPDPTRFDHVLGEADFWAERYAQSLDDDVTQENAAYCLDELVDTLSQLAPTGCYFGAHPGDGADFGYWQPEED